MKKRESRINIIESIISTHEVGSQEELLQLLENNGFVLTQATLSRDLKLLKVAKTVNDRGQYVYTLPRGGVSSTKSFSYNIAPISARGFISLQFSANIAVIRTLPGYASGMAYHIDNNQTNGDILGTIAGDDTIMLVLKEGVDYHVINEYISLMLSTFE